LKLLLTITAIIEATTGAMLFVLPSVVVSLLLGAPLSEPSGILLGRIAGASLISLAAACWLARNHTLPSLIMTKALIVYNAGAAILLIYATQVENFSAIGLWPAVLLHAGMFAWCVQSIRAHK
jgi:hypothetical protein